MNRVTAALASIGALSLPVLSAAEPASDPAVAFGTMPALWNARLSPDGSRVAFLQMHPEDLPILRVFDLETKAAEIALVSVPKEFDIRWCEWANDERLLCGYGGIETTGRSKYPRTRLVAADADGARQEVLLQLKLREWVLFQDHVVDWLVDDPKHVLVGIPGRKGMGVERLNIETRRTRAVEKARRNARYWMSDNRGTPRIFMYVSSHLRKWYARSAEGSPWRVLKESDLADLSDEYRPVGFAENPNTLFVIKPSKGRLALWSESLDDPSASKLVFSHPDVDLDGPLLLGKYRRMVAVGYTTDKPHLFYFDPTIEKIAAEIGGRFADRSVSVIDESWDRQRYLVHVGSDTKPGSIYLYETTDKRLQKIADQYPLVAGRELARMQSLRYAARDGEEVPAYLTLPPALPADKLPTVILPHGGPQSRDRWGFHWITQYLAARGYAVLQSNFRGSGGYGEGWAGDGGFKSWRLAVDDITDGARHLIEKGIADPNRICVAGWSYGGYAALMSAIEESELYRCVVSIAGVTDPSMLLGNARHLGSWRARRSFVGTEKEVLEAGSPFRRAGEIEVPVLLFHGDEDINVAVEHSRKLAVSLRGAGGDVTYVEYEEVEHQIARNTHRIDMLRRMGAFLDANLAIADPTPGP